MKALIAMLLVTVSFQAAAAKSEASSIKKLSLELGKAMGIKASNYQFKSGRDARSLVAQKYMSDNQIKKIDEDFSFTEMATEIASSDGSGLGTATLEAAQDLVTGMLDFTEFNSEGTKEQLEKRTKSAMALMKRLERAGAEFGYDSNGSGVCGVNFTTLLVIDVEESEVHEYVFVSGPC